MPFFYPDAVKHPITRTKTVTVTCKCGHSHEHEVRELDDDAYINLDYQGNVVPFDDGVFHYAVLAFTVASAKQHHQERLELTAARHSARRARSRKS